MQYIRYRHTKYLLPLIVFTGFLLRLWLANADPFLHDWDERFHALVAENMMQAPFKPMLKAHPITHHYDPHNWCGSHIWVHKQPLFLWQIAISMKLFGVSELSMRLPSIIMGTLMIILLFRISILFTRNEIISLIASALLAFSFYFLTLVAGIQGMDHNDVALCFYVMLSIWCYAEYLHRPHWYWVVLIGIFSGCAVLNKWLLGLLVFLGWGINILFKLKNRKIIKEIRDWAIALVICCIVFVPWQVYIFHTFPDQARYEMEFNRRHITEVLEGHYGTAWFYFHHFYNFFGNGSWPLLPLGILLAFIYHKSYSNKLLIAFFVQILFVFCFFSFYAKTKGINYLTIITPLCLIFIAIGIYYILKLIKKWYFIIPFSLLAVFDALNPIKIAQYLSSKNEARNILIHNTAIYKKTHNYLPANTKIVLNLSDIEDIAFMFYNNDISAQGGILSKEDMDSLKNKKIPVAAFKDHGKYILPEYVLQYPYLTIINRELR